MTALAVRCARIEVLVVDVDGVLTDGSIVYSDQGAELKSFHVRDGSGLKIWQKAGKRSGIITGRRSTVVDVRAQELGVSLVFQGAAEKLPAYRELLTRFAVGPEQVCYVGDDVPDLPVLLNCGLPVAVADACPEVRAAAGYVTRAAGGRGAVRETVELILRCQARWDAVVDGYRTQALD